MDFKNKTDFVWVVKTQTNCKIFSALYDSYIVRGHISAVG